MRTRYNLSHIFHALTLSSLSQQLLGSPAHQPTSGCGKVHDPYQDGESRDYSIFSSGGGGNRDFSIHLPVDYDPNTTYPLMISYHGGTETKEVQESITQFSNNTVNPGMIAVYPQGIKNTWEGVPFANASVDDKVFTGDLLNHLNSTYCIDPLRIFASGKSDGGGFCDTLACNATYGAPFAAFAPVAGAFYTDLNNSDCHPARSPIPILEFHDTDDGTIPYDGGMSKSGGQLPAIPDWLQRWAVRDGCLGNENVTTPHHGTPHHGRTGKLEYTTVTYSCNGFADIVSHYKSERKIQVGKDHIWPTLENSWIEASPLILEFCNKNLKP